MALWIARAIQPLAVPSHQEEYGSVGGCHRLNFNENLLERCLCLQYPEIVLRLLLPEVGVGLLRGVPEAA